MARKNWVAWLACGATAMLLAACGGGGSSGSGGGATVGGTDAGSGGSGGNGGSNGGSTTSLTYSVHMNATSGQVGVGRTLMLSAAVVDSNGTDVTQSATLSWSSSNTGVATVAGTSGVAGGGTVTGVQPGTVTIQLAASVTASDNTVKQLPVQTATVTVVAAGSTSYTLAIANPVLSMTDGQTLPVAVSLVDSNGTDVTSSVHDWSWSSSGPAVQVTPSANTASFLASNSSTTSTASAAVSVSVTAPNGVVLGGVIFVTVQKKATDGSDQTYRVVLSQNGAPITAISVLNGYPQVINARVLRNDGTDATASFDGTWTYASGSSTLSASADGSHNVTLTTTRANGADPLQSLLQVTAVSTKLSNRPQANLLVTEQPTWALENDNASTLVLTQLVPVPVPVTARLKHHGQDAQASECANWTWSSTSNVLVAPGAPPLQNQAYVSINGTGNFTVTATCTTVADQTPLSYVFNGVIQ
jgi:hypothetical protein